MVGDPILLYDRWVVPKGSPLMSIVSDDEPIVKLKDKYINKENDLTALHENDSETSGTAKK